MIVGSPLYMSPEIFQLYLREVEKEEKLEQNGGPVDINNNISELQQQQQQQQQLNYIKSDVYSTAISLIQIYNPNLPFKQKSTSTETQKLAMETRRQ